MQGDVMKAAIVSTENHLDAEIETDFGHSYYLLIVNLQNLDFEAFYSSDIEIVRGSGLKTAQLMINKGADTLLTHYCGSFCFQTLKATGIRIITGVKGSVRKALEDLKNGKLKIAEGPNIRIGSQSGAKSRLELIRMAVDSDYKDNDQED